MQAKYPGFKCEECRRRRLNNGECQGTWFMCWHPRCHMSDYWDSIHPSTRPLPSYESHATKFVKLSKRSRQVNDRAIVWEWESCPWYPPAIDYSTTHPPPSFPNPPAILLRPHLLRPLYAWWWNIISSKQQLTLGPAHRNRTWRICKRRLPCPQSTPRKASSYTDVLSSFLP